MTETTPTLDEQIAYVDEYLPNLEMSEAIIASLERMKVAQTAFKELDRYAFECEAGPLHMAVPFMQLAAMLDDGPMPRETEAGK